MNSLSDKWRNPKQRRKFFDDLANSKQFDPLNAENWYSITQKDICGTPVSIVVVDPLKFTFEMILHWKSFRTNSYRKGGYGVIGYYNGSYTASLIHLYPELKLEKSKFRNIGGLIKHMCEVIDLIFTESWEDPKKRRKFLDNFAQSKNFDPLDAEKWKSITYQDIRDAVS
jgi:hypothetical protein